jgi:uncharacterized protein YcbK (DUF882 family)
MAISRSTTVAMALLLVASSATAGSTPKPAAAARPTAAVTDANVAERVLAARTKADHEALAAYYKAKAKAEDPSIAHYDQLFRAYMKLEGKRVEPLQRQARALLKAARMFQKHYALLAQAHLNMAWEDFE